MALNDFTNSLPMLLYRASDAVMPRFRRIFNEFGITEQQWRVIRVLADAKSLPMRDLSEHCLIPPPSLAGIVDRMQKAGLVSRAASPGDRRKVLLALTSPGKDLQETIAPRVNAAYAELMQSVGAPEWIKLNEALHLLCERVSVGERD